MNFIEIGTGNKPAVVFAHGWARSHHDFIPTAEALGASARSLLVDLPGFGATPRPDAAWNTSDYADDAAAFLRAQCDAPIVWVGHSFGGRVGMRLAVRHPELVAGLVLVASAGVPRQRSRSARIRGWVRQRQFRLLRAGTRDAARIADLEKRFGSPDYVQSRELGLRDIFLKTISEDQRPDLHRISAPVSLLYGARDDETPPELGERIASLIPGAEMTVLPAMDHFSILTRGHNIIALRTKRMLAGGGA